MTPQKTFRLTIARVDGALFDADVISVSVPGQAGDMTILAQHEALISPLKEGVVSVVRDDHEVESFESTNGVIEVHDNHVSILL